MFQAKKFFTDVTERNARKGVGKSANIPVTLTMQKISGEL